MEYNWQVGQKVCVYSCGLIPNMNVDEIVKITPKGFIRVRGEQNLYNPDGSERTTSIRRCRLIRPATDEAIREYENDNRHRHLSHELNNTNFKSLPLPVLERIKAIVDEAKGVGRQ